MTGSMIASETRTRLQAEGVYLHRAVFGFEPAAEIVERYAAANIQCLGKLAHEQYRVDRIIERKLDVEAVECAMRHRDPGNLLTCKLQVLLYLVEVRRGYYRLFFNEKSTPIAGKVRICLAVIRSAYKIVKGHVLIRRHKLV